MHSHWFLGKKIKSCMTGSAVDDIDEVSKECKDSDYCKSKILSDGIFFVEKFKKSDFCSEVDPRTVWLKNANDDDKREKLDELLDESRFFDVMKKKCKGRTKNCKIVIKTNISISTRKAYKYYTDPEIVEHVVNRLNQEGYEHVSMVESDSFRSNPENIAVNLGYTKPVMNLSKERTLPVSIRGGNINFSERMMDADVVIAMPLMKNHHLMNISGVLKTMYGTLPDRDKYGLFHLKESGFDIPDATVITNHVTPVDFAIVDMIRTQDGNESPYHLLGLDRHFKGNLLIAGQDPLAIDKVMERKMGFDENESPIVERENEFRGNLDVETIPIIGGSLERIPEWRRVDKWYRVLSMIGQDITGFIKKNGINFNLETIEKFLIKDV